MSAVEEWPPQHREFLLERKSRDSTWSPISTWHRAQCIYWIIILSVPETLQLTIGDSVRNCHCGESQLIELLLVIILYENMRAPNEGMMMEFSLKVQVPGVVQRCSR